MPEDQRTKFILVFRLAQGAAGLPGLDFSRVKRSLTRHG